MSSPESVSTAGQNSATLYYNPVDIWACANSATTNLECADNARKKVRMDYSCMRVDRCRTFNTPSDSSTKVESIIYKCQKVDAIAKIEIQNLES